MVELGYTSDLKSDARKRLRVRVSPLAPSSKERNNTVDKEMAEVITRQLNQRANLLRRDLEGAINMFHDETNVLFFLRNADDYLRGLLNELRAAHIYVQDKME